LDHKIFRRSFLVILLDTTVEVILSGILVGVYLAGFLDPEDCDVDLRSLEILEVLLTPTFFLTFVQEES
jgi:hypothetical protein